MARVEELKKISILDVAEALGMELKQQGSDRYAIAFLGFLVI